VAPAAAANETVTDALSGRVALVTGSSRGIGAGIASLFAQHGALVAVHGRDRAALSVVRSDIERAGGRAIEVVADVTNFAEIEAVRRDVEAQLGPVDILVANAGANLTRPGLPVEETTEEGWRASIDANLTATFLTIKSVLPGMKERRRGNIVTMSSAAARRPSATSPIPYAVAKAGIQLLTQDLAAQVGPFGIRVNCIAPETILTERTTKQIPEALQTKLAEEHPMRRLGTPDDVAQAALYLASERASWITGVILDVAGGSVLA
jgi:3-oxoacyl-[acyl-carrier protein] reductase